MTSMAEMVRTHLRTGLSNGCLTYWKRMSLVNGSDTVKKISVYVVLIPYSIIQGDGNYSMYHSDKEALFTLFMILDANSNMLSGEVSERLIRKKRMPLIGHELLLMIITNYITKN